MDRSVSYAHIWDGSRRTPSIWSLNLIPLEDLSAPSKEGFSQDGFNK